MHLEEQIYNIIEGPLNHIGFNIVRLRLLNRSSGAHNMKILEILIERMDDAKVSIGDCKNASTHISAVLDVEDIIDSKYNLEVSSAGIERPLVKISDFVRFKNNVAEIKLHNAMEGTKKYQGKIIEVIKDQISLEVNKNKIIEISFDNIKDAKLVLTDELFRKIIK